METQKTLFFLVEDLKDPIVLVDANHIICHMNKSATKRYQRFGEVLGKSIFECHNQHSCEVIKEAYDRLKQGEGEVLISSNEKRKVFMKAVFDENKELLGYYERFEFLDKKD